MSTDALNRDLDLTNALTQKTYDDIYDFQKCSTGSKSLKQDIQALDAMANTVIGHTNWNDSNETALAQALLAELANDHNAAQNVLDNPPACGIQA